MVKGHQSPTVPGSKGGKGERVWGWGRVRWALDEEVIEGWGRKGVWLVAGVWGSWLVLLAVRDTGDGESWLFVCLCLKRIEVSVMISQKKKTY